MEYRQAKTTSSTIYRRKPCNSKFLKGMGGPYVEVSDSLMNTTTKQVLSTSSTIYQRKPCSTLLHYNVELLKSMGGPYVEVSV